MPKQDNSEKKAQEVNAAIEQIKAKFGESAIMRFGEAKRINVEVVPTGVVSIDLALASCLVR